MLYLIEPVEVFVSNSGKSPCARKSLQPKCPPDTCPLFLCPIF